MSEERPAYSSMVAGLAAAIRDDDPAPVGIGPGDDHAEPGTVYGALAAALAHERACWAETLRANDALASTEANAKSGGIITKERAKQSEPRMRVFHAEARQRWEDATALVAELRARIAGETEENGE